MEHLRRAIDSLRQTEASLRRIIGEAAEVGDYSCVETLARWATQLREMCPETPRAEGRPSEAPVALEDRSTTTLKPKKPAVRRRSYPFFTKFGETLVKIAWSKTSKSEYQHKSHKSVAEKLAEVLSRHGKNGAVVAMERVLPLKLDDGSEVPDYQVYVSLAWLRQIGVVKQNGRQGYTIKKPGELGKIVAAAWSELTEAQRTDQLHSFLGAMR